MRIYGLKACDTCRKAVKALEGAGHEAELVDIRATPLSAGDLARFLDAFGDALVNRRSTTWRGLGEAARARPDADLLAEHPALIKRPVIEADGALYLGWDKAVQAKLLG